VVLSSFQISLIAFEILSFAIGALLLARFLNLPGFKPMGSPSGKLGYWPMEGFEVALLTVLIFLLAIVSQGILGYFFGAAVKIASDRKGLELVLNGFATHGGGLLAWPLFYFMRRRLFASYNATPPASTSPEPIRARWTQALLGGLVTFLIVFAVIAVVSAGWNGLLNLLGIPAEAQELIAIFKATKSPLLLTGMFFVACVLAPINEELLFRRGLYHFFRQRFGRIFALVVSASLFALLHGNMAGVLPLAVLGVILALAYERTGDIRVPIIAHSLFNLNTLVILLAGLAE